MSLKMSVGEYLIKTLEREGLKHIFGLQGDYVLGFYSMLNSSSIKVINTCDEQSAGFAADAYARITGFGAVCVTYGVGGLKLINSTAQAFAENSPVMVISGAAGLKERDNDRLLHHKVLSFESQMNVFREMTAEQAILDNPKTAASLIDNAVKSLRALKLPVYIELPRDMVNAEIEIAKKTEYDAQTGNRALANEVAARILDRISVSERPFVIAGIYVQRFGLQSALIELLERTGFPFVTGLLGKSVISENHPQFMGVYAGAMTPDHIRDSVEASDCPIIIGPLISDLSTGMFTSGIEFEKCIVISPNNASVFGEIFYGVEMKDLLEAVLKALPVNEKRPLERAEAHERTFTPQPNKEITVNRLMECLNSFIDDSFTVIAEPGDALFAALDLKIEGDGGFISPAYYASIGFSVPASLGVQLAAPEKRAIIITGDGAFQMTGMELSVSASLNLNPIVIILNNKGFGTFRSIIDGSFNDIPVWDYAEIVRVIGSGKGYRVKTEEEALEAIACAKENINSPSIIDVRIGRGDCSARLQKLTEELKKKLVKP